MKRSKSSITIILLMMLLMTSLVYAQRQPKKPLEQAVVEGDIDRIKQEMAAGTNVDSKNRSGWTLLYIAVNSNHPEIAKLLIEKGADVNATGSRGKRPIHIAVQKGQKSIVEALIAKKADLNVIDASMDNALTLARKHKQKEIEDLLLKNGAEEPDLSLLDSERLYGTTGGQQGANVNPAAAGSRNQARRGANNTRANAQVDLLANPTEIKTRVSKIAGLEKAIGEVSEKSKSEDRQWLQTRSDNRTILARYIDKQIEDELNLIQTIATEEKAEKTVAAIDKLRTERRKTTLRINKELLAQRREQSMTSAAGMRGRGRTTGRSTRGRAPVRGQATGSNSTDSLYGEGSINMQRGAGFERERRAAEQLDPITEEQMRQWLQTTPDKKLDLAKALHPQIQDDFASVRTIAVEEKAEKTTAAIDGVLLARKERYDALVVKIEQENIKLQQRMGLNSPNNQDQGYQRGTGYGRRGTGTHTNTQQQTSRRGRRR